MAKQETESKPKNIVEAVPEEIEKLEKDIEKIESEELAAEPQARLTFKEMKALRAEESKKRALEMWVPKTALGKLVKHGKIKNMDEIIDEEKKVLEPEIVDILLPSLEFDLISAGQAKGKFGGGKRRAWRQTQKKTMEGNVLTFSCFAIVGDKKGHIGMGCGKSKETLPSREKAVRNAKLSLVRITRGFESPESETSDPHTVPFVVEGKCGSIRLKLIPAPRGTGLVVADECKKILKLAGIKDVYSKTKGKTQTSFNLAKACINALLKTNKMKL